MTVIEPERILIGKEIPAFIWRGQGEGPRPVITSVHGGSGSKADIEMDAVERLVDAGITQVTIDAYQHGERAPQGFNMTHARTNLAVFLEIIEHTARDLFTVLGFLRGDRDIDSVRIGLRGGSMGGYIVLMAVGLEFPTAAVLSICGGAGYERIWDLRGSGRVQPGAPEVLARAPEVDPIYHAAAFPPRPVLLIHGARDPIVPIAGQRALYEALMPLYSANPGDCLFLTHAGEHATPPEIERMGWEWLVRMLLKPTP